MILCNREILEGIDRGAFSIQSLAGRDPSRAPFNTSSVDLHLGDQLVIPKSEGAPVNLDLRRGKIAEFWAKHCERITIAERQPYQLQPRDFLLGQTIEKVHFPLNVGGVSYGARVEGRSSLARCGILVHFTAPTIHAGFEGPITLEITNLGPLSFLLYPGLAICQLIIEEVRGDPLLAPNQFSGQVTPEGRR